MDNRNRRVLKKIRPLCLAFAAALAFPAHAATPLSLLKYIPDITVNLSGTVVGPADVANDTFVGAPTVGFSAPANLAAYYHRPAGFLSAPTWLVFDATVVLPGGITATPRDVISYDGAGYAKFFDGVVAGIPVGVAIDAISSTDGVDLLLSFDTTATVGAVTAAPEDVVRYAGGWSSYFVGSTAGVPAGANLDALHFLSNGHLLTSFDIAGTVGGVPFGAGDVLEYTPTGSVWEMAFSPAGVYAGWGAANLRGLWAQEALPGFPGTLQFSAPAYSVNETGVTATITVTRSGGNTGPVTVNYASSNGTATAPDYTTGSGTLTWGSGVITPQTFAVPVTNDALVEGNETVLLTLSAPSGGASLGTASATLTIVDDDLPPNTPLAGISANNLNFGNQVVATPSGVQTVTVTNNGNVNLLVSAVTAGGANPGDYGITDNCTGNTVVPLASCSINVVFTPGVSGARAASLSIVSNDANSPAAVSFAGSGITAPIGGGVTPIPTLSEWGMILLSSLLGLMVAARMSRKSGAGIGGG